MIITVGKSKDVAICIPECLFKPLDCLSNPDIRKICNIHPNNKYLMPSGKRSLDASSGQDNLRQFLKFWNINEENLSSVKVCFQNVAFHPLKVSMFCKNAIIIIINNKLT